MKLVVASNNPGKLREFGQLLAPLGWETVAQKELGVPECEEPHHTFVENALEKARHAARCTGLPALADDSGLCVHALGGAPAPEATDEESGGAGGDGDHRPGAESLTKSRSRGRRGCSVYIGHGADVRNRS